MTSLQREIPDDHNVVRYVGLAGLDNGRPDGSQFCLSAGQSGLSVNWLEYFDYPTREEQLAGIRQVIHRTLGRREVFAELNIGDVKRFLETELPAVRVIRAPTTVNDRFPADPSHCDVMGLPPAEAGDAALIIGDMIAKRVTAVHPAAPQG